MHTFQTRHHDGQIEKTLFHKVIIEVKVKGQGHTMNSYLQRTNQYFSVKLSTVMDKEERNGSAKSSSRSRSTVKLTNLMFNKHRTD
jgi:hypothetical protein